jgi:hemoglobin-like flavoprotein
MTEEQIQLVKKTWKVFRDIDPGLLGDVFYTKLFAEVPQIKHLFKTSRQEQSKKLVDMINLIIGRLDRLNEVTDEIKQLAVRHIDYGVKASHYEPVGAALLWTLKQGLGKDWNPEVEAAWAACYRTLSETMIEAASNSRHT